MTLFEYQQRSLVTYTGRWDGVIQGRRDYTGYGAWQAGGQETSSGHVRGEGGS